MLLGESVLVAEKVQGPSMEVFLCNHVPAVHVEDSMVLVREEVFGLVRQQLLATELDA